MTGWGWPELLALLSSVGFGVVSAIVPLANAETYVVASQVSAVAGLVPVAVGIGIGQTVGKVLLFQAVRQGRNSRFLRHRRTDAAPRPRSRFRDGLARAIRALLALVGTKRWGLPIVLLAAVVGIPPLYAVALLAGATRMRTVWFALVVLVGRITRFVLVAVGATGMLGIVW